MAGGEVTIHHRVITGRLGEAATSLTVTSVGAVNPRSREHYSPISAASLGPLVEPRNLMASSAAFIQAFSTMARSCVIDGFICGQTETRQA